MARDPRPVWTAEHREAIDLFERGRNLFVTGSAGSGKTMLTNHLISLAGTHGVHRTALTGLAALNLRGTTLHKYAGCGLARGDVDFLYKNMSFPTKGRWRTTRVLFVDEVSMLDADLFEKLDAVRHARTHARTPSVRAPPSRCARPSQLARRVRMAPHDLFGGIQLVMVGDFFQLPPVGAAGPDGAGRRKRMLFESPAFRSAAVCKVRGSVPLSRRLPCARRCRR